MKGVIIIHPFTYSNGETIFNFDVLIEKTWINKLRFKQISKMVERKTSYITTGCPNVKDFMRNSKKKYWHLGSDDLNHCTPEFNNKVVDDLLSLNISNVVVMYE